MRLDSCPGYSAFSVENPQALELNRGSICLASHPLPVKHWFLLPVASHPQEIYALLIKKKSLSFERKNACIRRCLVELEVMTTIHSLTPHSSESMNKEEVILAGKLGLHFQE